VGARSSGLRKVRIDNLREEIRELTIAIVDLQNRVT